MLSGVLAGALLMTPPTYKNSDSEDENSKIVQSDENNRNADKEADSGKLPWKMLIDCSVMKPHFILYLSCIVSMFLKRLMFFLPFMN